MIDCIVSGIRRNSSSVQFIVLVIAVSECRLVILCILLLQLLHLHNDLLRILMSTGRCCDQHVLNMALILA
jgi:hypothetical protein